MNEIPFGITKEEITELAATKIADSLLDADVIEVSVAKKIEARLENLFGTKIKTRVDSFLSEEMTRILSKEIHPVDIYGEKTGEPTSIQAVLAERAKVFWDTKVDEKGNPAGSWGAVPRHEHLFRKIVNEEFEKAVKQNIVNLVGAFKDALSASANKITQEHIDSLIKVNTNR